MWWPLLCGLWLLTLSTFPREEVVAAVVLSLPCAAAAGVARRAVGASWRPRASWARWLPPLPGAVLADTGAANQRPRSSTARTGPERSNHAVASREGDAAHQEV